MKAINALLVTVLAGTCASVAMAGDNDGVTHYMPLRKPIPASRVVVTDASGGGGFGTRFGALMSYYDCRGDEARFEWTNAGTYGESLNFEKGGATTVGGSPVTVGPVAAPARLGSISYGYAVWDGTSSTTTILDDFYYSIELFSDTIDWMWKTATCTPEGNNGVAHTNYTSYPVGMGGIAFLATGKQNLFGYQINDLDFSTLYVDSGGYFNWQVSDGNCFIDRRTWADADLTVPSSVSGPRLAFPIVDSGGCGLATTEPGTYPALGESRNAFYFDANGDGFYQRDETYWFGAPETTAGNPVANSFLVLKGNDGCEDYNGDGFPNGDDGNYVSEILFSGCGY